jgi:hypothetical protein
MRIRSACLCIRARLQSCRSFGYRQPALAAEVRFFSRGYRRRIDKPRTSGAEALKNAGQCGTAEAVPFQDRILTQTLKAPRGYLYQGTAEVVPDTKSLMREPPDVHCMKDVFRRSEVGVRIVPENRAPIKRD